MMKVKVRTGTFRLFLPLPLGMARFALRCIPERAFRQMRAGTPAPYSQILTKENLRLLVGECLDALKECKGLEIVHVEGADGTFVSIRI